MTSRDSSDPRFQSELAELREALSKLVRPSEIEVWMERPNSAFEGLKPIELLQRGQADRLWRMIYEMESGNGF